MERDDNRRWNGLSLEVAWCDADVPELRVRAASGGFAGECDVFATAGEIAALADALRGFPSTSGDQRYQRLGTFQSAVAGGGLRLGASEDGGGARIEIELCRRVSTAAEEERVRIRFPVDAAALEHFVADLDVLSAGIGPGSSTDGRASRQPGTVVGRTAVLAARAGP